MTLRDDIQTAYEKYKNKAYIEAEIDIRNLLAKHPAEHDVLRLGALTALAINQVVTAQTRMSQACANREMNAEMYNSWGNIYKASEEWGQAENAYEKAMALNPRYLPVRNNLIDLFISSGQADRANSEIDRQIKTYGESDILREAKILALTDLGLYEQAWDIAMAINSKYRTDKIIFLKTQLLFYVGRYQDMSEMAALIPASSDYAARAVALAANAYAMTNDHTALEALIDKAVDHDDANPQMFAAARQSFSRIGLDSRANDILERGNDKFGRSNSVSISEEANALYRSGDYTGAVHLYQQALSGSPGNFDVMMKYANACIPAKAYDKCQNLLQGALQQAPNNQFIFALAATLYRARGGDYQHLYDYDKLVQSYDLSTPQGYATIRDFNAALKTRLDEYHIFQSAPVNQSLRGGTQTNINLALVDDPIIRQFFMMLDGPIKSYMKHIGHDASHPFLRRNTGRYRFNGAWSVKLSPNGHHVNHVHPKGWISSSYYVDVPKVVDDASEKQGWIKFGEPGIEGVNLPAEKFIKPEGGRLVLFPSYMWHGTIPFSGETSRLTLPFDVVPA